MLQVCMLHRARLYRISSKDMDSETQVVSSEWRESCKKAILPHVCTQKFIGATKFLGLSMHVVIFINYF